MATIGDPLMDLGTSLGYWVEANDPEEIQAVAKMLLAGADAVQIVSAFYKHGLDRLAAIRGLPPIVVGAPVRAAGPGKPLLNAAVLIRDGERIGVVGFCMGGGFALIAAAEAGKLARFLGTA